MKTERIRLSRSIFLGYLCLVTGWGRVAVAGGGATVGGARRCNVWVPSSPLSDQPSSSTQLYTKYVFLLNHALTVERIWMKFNGLIV